MARIYGNDKCTSGNFGDSSQLTNWILYSVETCHMTTESLGWIPVLLEDRDKHIKVVYGYHFMEKGKKSTNKIVRQ